MSINKQPFDAYGIIPSLHDWRRDAFDCWATVLVDDYLDMKMSLK
jgi:hypothetical protein